MHNASVCWSYLITLLKNYQFWKLSKVNDLLFYEADYFISFSCCIQLQPHTVNEMFSVSHRMWMSQVFVFTTCT